MHPHCCPLCIPSQHGRLPVGSDTGLRAGRYTRVRPGNTIDSATALVVPQVWRRATVPIYRQPALDNGATH